MARTALIAAVLLLAFGLPWNVTASPADYEWSWKDYTPNSPPRVIEATVGLEFLPLPHIGGLDDDFFVAMRNHAAADLGNMFARTVSPADGEADYVIRLGFVWKHAESHPSAEVVEARSNRVLASLSRPSPGLLRAVALNLRDAMGLLKGDIAQVILQNPAAPAEPPPRHRDPL